MSLTMWLPVLEDVGGLDTGGFTINDFMARGSDPETDPVNDPETDPVPETDTLLDLRIDPPIIEPDEIESPPIRSPLIESPAIDSVILTEITNTIHITYTTITTWITDE